MSIVDVDVLKCLLLYSDIISQCSWFLCRMNVYTFSAVAESAQSQIAVGDVIQVDSESRYYVKEDFPCLLCVLRACLWGVFIQSFVKWGVIYFWRGGGEEGVECWGKYGMDCVWTGIRWMRFVFVVEIMLSCEFDCQLSDNWYFISLNE